MMIKSKELINKRKFSKNNSRLPSRSLENMRLLPKIYQKESEITPLKSETEGNPQETKTYLKDTPWIEEAELVESNILFYC
jgi:hypothetical protein